MTTKIQVGREVILRESIGVSAENDDLVAKVLISRDTDESLYVHGSYLKHIIVIDSLIQLSSTL